MKGETLDGEALVMAEGDTVATALDDLSAGRTFEVDGRTVELAEEVPFGHKFALSAHAPGDEIRKYGEPIGRATGSIEPGAWVHTHNVESARGRGDLASRGGPA